MIYHKSVLLQEVIEGLKVKSGQKYIDATLGGGGHASSIIEKGGLVLGIDADSEAIEFAEKLKAQNLKLKTLRTARGNFRNIDKIARENGFDKVCGILFDLGLSSYQIDEPKRGFSYLKSGPLDMRMDQGLGVKASDLLNALGKRELYEIFKKLGEEHHAHSISERIISARRIKPFETTDDLVKVLTDTYGFNNKTDFAKAKSSKKVFQALRIAVNDELGTLKEAIPKALNLLEKGGRVAVITFHSLEDRIVKQTFIEFEKEEKGKAVNKKPILPSSLEIEQNNRSRGAKLRIFEAK
ncbi:MAG: Ribosomal RNA small subunit methyltransferase H [Microgenomates group bacterium GW2011_GWA2_37_6]|nr:MAG: Ribosomal RNA small subunit methyltransferase H [Microgenomates group bacterium GW2011_GWA2_37_6]